MKKLRNIALLFWLVAWAGTAVAQVVQPAVDREGADGFTAVAIITTDENWRKLWEISARDIPEFQLPESLYIGERATVLIFFSGAETLNGEAQIWCDFKILQAGSGIYFDEPPRRCFTGMAEGGSSFLTELDIEFWADRPEDIGTMVFEIGVTDALRNLRLQLEVSVKIVGGTT